MVKTTLKIDGMMCSMCEAHMNDLVRQNCSVKKGDIFCEKTEKPLSSVKNRWIFLCWIRRVRGIGYTLLSHESEPYEKKGLFHRK